MVVVGLLVLGNTHTTNIHRRQQRKKTFLRLRLPKNFWRTHSERIKSIDKPTF